MWVCALVVWLSLCGWLGPGPRGESSLVVGSALVCWCLFARVGVARSQPRPRPRRDVVHTLKAAPGLPVLEGACYYLLLSQSCVAQRQSIRLNRCGGGVGLARGLKKGVTAHLQRFVCARHTRPGTVVPTTQTTSPTTPRCRRYSPRWSALWAPRRPEP